MDTAIVLASSSSPDPVADAADRLADTVGEAVVVCAPERRDAVAAAADSSPRIVADAVPGGGPVAAMRTGFRVTGARRAFVTTPGTPALAPGSLCELVPDGDADATLALVDGERRPPCGGYRVSPATAACDTTLAMGSRRLSDVLARLSVETADVESLATTTASGASATGTQ